MKRSFSRGDESTWGRVPFNLAANARMTKSDRLRAGSARADRLAGLCMWEKMPKEDCDEEVALLSVVLSRILSLPLSPAPMTLKRHTRPAGDRKTIVRNRLSFRGSQRFGFKDL